MTTGTGLVMLGVWVVCAVCWHSKIVPGFTAATMTVVAIVLTWWLK